MKFAVESSKIKWKEVLRFFACLAILGKCLTADNLRKRGWPHDPIDLLFLQGSGRVCRSPPGTLLLYPSNHCNLPTTLAPTGATSSLAEWWESNVVSINLPNSRGWGGLAVAIWWFTWRKRNTRIFQNKVSTVSGVFNSMMDEFMLWNQAGRHRIQQILDRPREPD